MIRALQLVGVSQISANLLALSLILFFIPFPKLFNGEGNRSAVVQSCRSAFC